jgi:CubicO group peptidase (beta-lactamase class C family)
MKHEPGEVFQYDDLGVHLLAHILTRVTGMRTADFAQSRLFQPLGIWQDEQGEPAPWKQGSCVADSPHLFFLWEEQNEALWSIDRLGYHLGRTVLQLTPREICRIFLCILVGKGQTYPFPTRMHRNILLTTRVCVPHTPVASRAGTDPIWIKYRGCKASIDEAFVDSTLM